MSYAGSKREFEPCFMIVMMMGYYLEDDYLETVLDIIDKIESEFYYVNMASAWLVSVAFVKSREVALRFLRDNHLSDFVQNKAIQKITESYRVSDEDKTLVRAYKRLRT